MEAIYDIFLITNRYSDIGWYLIERPPSGWEAGIRTPIP